MTKITLAIPTELKKEMDKFATVNWSEVAQGAFQKKLEDIKFLKKFTSDSEFTLEDAERIGREISANLGERYTRDE
jgi:hypothetical protein